MPISYLKGDATKPVGAGERIIAHVVNDIGAWGAGFTRALSKWPEAESSYRSWFREGLALGKTLARPLYTDGIVVVHMCAQSGLRSATNSTPLKYPALGECLRVLGTVARGMQASVHMPRIGCGLAGGSWDRVEPLVVRFLGDVEVFVYDLE